MTLPRLRRLIPLAPVVSLALGCGVPFAGSGAVVSTLGGRGLLPGQFVKPRAAALDAEDRLYLVDMRAMIQVFDAKGKRLAGWQTPTHEFGRPSGLAIDPQGNLVVADSHYHRLLVYAPDGRLLRTVGGDEGSAPLSGYFGYIGDVAVSQAGDWFVAESQERERITKLSPDGQIILAWGDRGADPGQFSRIRALAIREPDRLYVADACNHRVQVFDFAGSLVCVIGEQGEGSGQFAYPYDIAIGPEGNLYVCEYGNHRVQKLDPEGRPLGTWGVAGREVGQLWNPWALAVRRDGLVHVVDSNNHRIQTVRF